MLWTKYNGLKERKFKIYVFKLDENKIIDRNVKIFMINFFKSILPNFEKFFYFLFFFYTLNS